MAGAGLPTSGTANVAADTTPTLGGDLTTDTYDITTDTTTGTKIGLGATEKWGFWGAAPVVQPSHIADPVGSASENHTITDGAETCTRSQLKTYFDQLGAKLNANSDAIDSILAQLATTGLHASS